MKREALLFVVATWMTTCGGKRDFEASNYDQSCTRDSDCVAVFVGTIGCCPGCPNAAINKADYSTYEADLAAAPRPDDKQCIGWGSCAMCPAATAVCVQDSCAIRSGADAASDDGGDASSTGSPDGGGDAGGNCTAPANYPAGPYGVDIGDTISDALCWQGYPKGSSAVAWIGLGDLYDPDGKKGIGAILVNESTTWNGASHQESSGMEQCFSSDWRGLGVAAVVLLCDQGVTTSMVNQWKTQYLLTDVSVGADPEASLFDPGTNGLPINVVVDPRTMKVISRENGPSGGCNANVALLARMNKTD